MQTTTIDTNTTTNDVINDKYENIKIQINDFSILINSLLEEKSFIYEYEKNKHNEVINQLKQFISVLNNNLNNNSDFDLDDYCETSDFDIVE